MNPEDLVKKLSILEKKTSDLLADSSVSVDVSNYLKATADAIRSTQNEVKSIEVNSAGYSPQFAVLAYKILSSSPFTTKAHLCVAFRKNTYEIDKWISEYPSFEKSVEQGVLEGEVKSRDLMVQASFEPATKVNTALLKMLSTNVYNIKDTQDISLKVPEPIKFQVEVVSAAKNTNT